MSRRSPLRDRLPFTPRQELFFRWRGTGVSRVEGLADGVFAFAVALLIVSAEVPRTFEGLMDAVRGFPAFAVCFTLLMLFWNAHYRFFRRYGIEDRYTRTVTMAILLLVLFSVYPLKYLFGAVLVFGRSNAPVIENVEQMQSIYLVYGLGFIGVWTLYGLLYLRAWRLRRELELSVGERLQTREALLAAAVNIAVCLVSIALSRTGLASFWPGLVYSLLGPLLAANGYWHGNRVRAWARANGGPGARLRPS